MIDLGIVQPGLVELDLTRRLLARGARGGRSLLGLALAVLAALGLLVSGAQRPGTVSFAQLTSVPVAPGVAYAIDGDTLYVAQARADGNGLSAYRLPGGEPRWSTALPSMVAGGELTVIGPAVLVSVYTVIATGDRTVAVDRATGRIRWRSPLTVASVRPETGQVVLVEYSAAGPDLSGSMGASEIRVVAAATGLTAWSYLVPPGCQQAIPATLTAADRALPVMCPRGDLRLVDLADGSVARRATLPELTVPRADGSAVWPNLDVVGDRILVGYPTGGTFALAAYDDTLRRRWTWTLANGLYYAFGCAGQLCVSDGGGLVVLAPESGTLRWRVTLRGYTRTLGDGMLLLPPTGNTGQRLVTAGTGRAVLDLGGWQATGGDDGVPVFLHWEPDAGRTWFGMLDTGPARLPSVRPVGFAADVLTGSCRASAGYLACRSVRDTVRVWRYRTQ